MDAIAGGGEAGCCGEVLLCEHLQLINLVSIKLLHVDSHITSKYRYV